MKIHYIELNGYLRFMLNEIDHFAMTLKSPLQIVIGTNGSGKSSLLQQLTPFPPNHADFAKTGSKIIHIEHRGSFYILKAVFQPGQKHYFEKDGVVLNDFGTLSVQKELVKQHFAVDQNVFNLLTGEDRFHSMSPSRRKEWFIELCETNYDYAIGIYNKLREKQRDAQGALKIAKRKLIVETEKIIKKEDELRIQKEVSQLHQTLSELLEHRKPIEKNLDELEHHNQKVTQGIYKAAQRIESLLAQLGSQRAYQEPQLQSVINGFNQRIHATQALMQKAGTEHQTNQERIEVLQKAEHQTIASLQTDLLSLEQKLNALKSKLLFYKEGFDAVLAEETFGMIKPTLADLFSKMPPNPDRKYSSDKLTLAREQMDELKRQHTGLLETQSTLKAQVKHMENHRDNPNVTCVSCAHRFSLNFHPTVYHQHLQDIDTLSEKITQQIKPKIAELEAYIEQCQEYARDYRLFVMTTQNAHSLSAYWARLVDSGILITNPQFGLTELNQIETDLQLQKQVVGLEKTKKEKQDLLNSLRSVGTSDLTGLLKQNTQLAEQIETHTQRLFKLQQRSNAYAQTLNQLKALTQAHQTLLGLWSNKETLVTDVIETHRRLIFNDLIRALQSLLGSKEHILSEARMQQGIIDNVIRQIAELETEDKAFTALVKSLSPTDGLIAEGLFSFIKAFIHQMNCIIAKIWTYPMVIQPCELSGDTVDLDYKFAVKINNESRLRSDVSRTSEGQKEIIDLAFLMTAMSYLDMRDSALHLDEIGAAFDAAHKGELIIMLKTLIEQESFSQIWMVSHDHHQYSALNAQVCVLNSSNVLLPANYNEHVVTR